MRRSIFTVIIILFSIELFAFTQQDVWNYINTYKGLAMEQERLYGMPATITLAQGILESGAGKSGLTRNSNNHFGIKAGSKWKGPIHKAWDDDPYKSSFRKYKSASESYSDHTQFLKNSRNFGWMFKQLSVFDYRGWAKGLKAHGYATAPRYAQDLIAIIEKYRLYEINGGMKLKSSNSTTVYRTIIREVIVEIPNVEPINDEEETEEEVVYNEVMSLPYRGEINGVRCTRLYPGESLSNIARNYDIPKQKLLEYNEITNENELQEGDIIYLTKKKNKFTDPQDYYTVKEGDNIYKVSQRFGVTMAYLAKINNKRIFDKLSVGEKLLLK